MTETKVVRVTAEKVCVQMADRKEKMLAADAVVLTIGSRSKDKLVKEIGDQIKEVYTIGKDVSPRKISRCICDAVELGVKI